MPKENKEMEIFSSTQNPSEIQMFVSSVLNVPSNRINVRVKRMGQSLGLVVDAGVPLSPAIYVEKCLHHLLVVTV